MLSGIYREKGDLTNEKFYLDKAERIFPNVLEMMRQRVETLCLETDELLEKHNLKGAERLLKEARKIDPNATPVLVDLGVLSAEKGDLQKSLEYLTKALSLNPRYPPVHYNLAIVYQMMGKKDEAETEMMKYRATEAVDSHNGNTSGGK